MSKRMILLAVLGILLVAAFGVGLLLVNPGGDWVSSLPVVGELVGNRGSEQQRVLTPEILTAPNIQGGIQKSVGADGATNYVISGRLLEDGFIRDGDGMMQSKLVIDGHLQSQPLTFVAGFCLSGGGDASGRV